MPLKYIRILSLLFLVASTFGLKAQDWQLVMDLMISDEGQKFPGAEVKLIQNGKIIQNYTADSRGQVDVPIPTNGVYILDITAPGYVHKKLEIDTRNVNPEDIGEGEILYRADVDIFKKIEGLNLTILDEPIGQIWYDDAFGGFTYNKEYTLSKQAALTELKESYLQMKKEEAERLAKNKKLYDEAIKKADQAYKSENWQEAKTFYEQAQELDPSNTYPSFQLGEIATKIIKNEANQQKYDAAIKLADAALTAKDYKEAIAQYKKAQGYKPDDQYAAGKIVEAQGLAVQAAKVEQNYLAAIEKGDNALLSNELETAKTAFLEAQKLKPEETYPSSKLAEIESIFSKKQESEDEYKNAIASGDKFLAAQDYQAAKTSFQKASTLKPNEAYPKGKIAEIESALTNQAKKEQDYLAAITEADNAVTAKEYEDAISAFQRASAIKPSEEYPKKRIAEISTFIAANAEKAKKYEAAIKTADQALATGDIQSARSSYSTALEIKPSESYPQQKIAEIDKLIAERKASEEKYNAAIASADKAYNAKNFESAKSLYESALALRPEESYPQEKITEISALLADAAKKESNYSSAIASADEAFKSGNMLRAKELYQQALGIKASETYPKTKLEEINGKLAAAEKTEADYKAGITKADNFYSAKDYQSALEAYSNAISIKPGESYPSQKITEIEAIIKTIAAEKEADRLAQEQQSKLEADYKNSIAQADQLFAEKKWDEAITAYNQALALKPSEKYPVQRLDEIKLRKQEELAELQQEEVDAAYQEAIAKADKAFAEKNYDLAKTSYSSALEIKNTESYPSEKLSEIESIQAQLAQVQAKQAAEEEENNNYQKAIAEADRLLAEKQFEAARKSYNAALAIKPNEQYPKSQLAVIDSNIQSNAQQQAAEQLAEEKAAKAQADYLAAIAFADRSLENKEFQTAKSKYQEAMILKPEEAYPKQKIQEIEALLTQNAEEESANLALLEEKENKEKEYNSLIAKAESNLKNDELLLALRDFKSALAIKPSESYPQTKIDEIDQLIAQKAAEAEKNEAQAEIQAQQEMNYQSAIKEADALYREQNWQAALAKYSEANRIKPSESYPQQQIEAVNGKIEEEQQLAEKQKAAEEEKIRVSNMPVSNISGETEENIDKMYQEIWEENKSGKESYFVQQKSQVEESNLEMRKREEDNKKNAIERLEEIAISYEQSVKQSTRLNKQNYETVKNNQEIYANSEKELRVNGQRQREENWDIQQDLAQNIQEFQNETSEKNSNQYVNDLKERTENHRANIETYRKNQERIREQRNSDYVSMAQEWDDYKKHLKEKFERENSQRIAEVKEYHLDYSTTNSENQKQAIAKINNQLEAQADFINRENKKQQDVIEQKAAALKDRKEELVEMEEQRRSYSTRRIEGNAQEEYYTGEAKLREDSLAQRYPQGISEEVIESRNGSTTIKRIVVNNTQADVYTKTLHTWGGVFYTKNGRNITEETWNLETE